MSPSELELLKRKLPVSATVARLNSGAPADSRNWAPAKFQKHEVDLQKEGRPAIHRDGPKKEKVDGPGHPAFRVSITLRISDERHRDLDGAASTILDCLCSSVGRLAPVDQGTDRDLREGAEG